MKTPHSSPSDSAERFILEPQRIPDYLYCEQEYSDEAQPMRKGFTADVSTLQFPKTANTLANMIRNHFDTEPTGKPKAFAELSPFITLWSTKRDVEDDIVRLRRAEDGSIRERGFRDSHRLYAIDGTKLGLLKVKVIRVQDVFDSEGLDDDGSHDDEYLVWARSRR